MASEKLSDLGEAGNLADVCHLILKAQSRLQQMTVLNIFSLFSGKIMLDISCESSGIPATYIPLLGIP